VKLNNTLTFSLPPKKDDENNPINLNYSCIPNITDIVASFNGSYFEIKPTKWQNYQLYKCLITLSDGLYQSFYPFNIDVTNSAPKFLNGRSPDNIKVKLGDIYEYELTNVLDEEQNPLSITSL
jgi:hypothetical protein